jgi:predicted transcriptional regulator
MAEQNMAAPAKPSVLTKGFRDELDLLSRHVRMLQFVQKHGPIGIIRLSQLLGEPKHKVRYSLRILEKEGYIKPSTAGAQATEKVTQFFQSVESLLGDVTKKIHELLADLKKGPQ